MYNFVHRCFEYCHQFSSGAVLLLRNKLILCHHIKVIHLTLWSFSQHLYYDCPSRLQYNPSDYIQVSVLSSIPMCNMEMSFVTHLATTSVDPGPHQPSGDGHRHPQPCPRWHCTDGRPPGARWPTRFRQRHKRRECHTRWSCAGPQGGAKRHRENRCRQAPASAWDWRIEYRWHRWHGELGTKHGGCKLYITDNVNS